MARLDMTKSNDLMDKAKSEVLALLRDHPLGVRYKDIEMQVLDKIPLSHGTFYMNVIKPLRDTQQIYRKKLSSKITKYFVSKRQKRPDVYRL